MRLVSGQYFYCEKVQTSMCTREGTNTGMDHWTGVLVFISFLNKARAHSWPKAGCGCEPGLLKLFSEKCMCVCMYACLFVYLFVFPHPREQNLVR